MEPHLILFRNLERCLEQYEEFNKNSRQVHFEILRPQIFLVSLELIRNNDFDLQAKPIIVFMEEMGVDCGGLQTEYFWYF